MSLGTPKKTNMATLSIVIQISSADATSENLQISESDSVTVQPPIVNTARISVATGGKTQLLDAAVYTSDTWVYLKNVDATNFMTVSTDASVNFAKLAAGEIMVFPLIGGAGIEFEADTSACILEYGIWTV